MWKIFLCTTYLVLLSKCIITAGDDSVTWKWACKDGKCAKLRHDPSSGEPALSLEACKMFCNEYGLLWPRPTGEADLGNFLSKINANDIRVHVMKNGRSADLMEAAGEIQGQLRVTKMGKCYFVGYISPNHEITILEIDRDDDFISKMMPKLVTFYKKCVLPEVVLRRVSKN